MLVLAAPLSSSWSFGSVKKNVTCFFGFFIAWILRCPFLGFTYICIYCSSVYSFMTWLKIPFSRHGFSNFRWWSLVTKLWQLAMLLVKCISYQDQRWFLVHQRAVKDMSGYHQMKRRKSVTGKVSLVINIWNVHFSFAFLIVEILLNFVCMGKPPH